MDPHFYALIHATYVKNAQDALIAPMPNEPPFRAGRSSQEPPLPSDATMPLRLSWAEVGAACPLLEQGMAPWMETGTEQAP